MIGYLAQPYRRQTAARTAAIALVLIGILVRVPLPGVYSVTMYDDSTTYFALAQQLRHLDFANYTGWRTPGYPLLLLIAGANHQWLWFLQFALGIGVSLVIFAMSLNASHSVSLSFVTGLSQSLVLNQLFFESAILTETLCTFLVALSCLLITRMLLDARPTARFALWCGLATSFVALTRPLYVLLGPLYLLLIISRCRGRAIKVAGTFAVSFGLPVFLWICFNHVILGYSGMTTLLGFNLTNHSGGFIDYAPDSTIKDVYLKYRARRASEGKDHAFTVFEAAEEMEAKTGLSRTQLSRQLTKISMDLFTSHPLLYAASVARAWWSFWAVPNYWRVEQFSDAKTASVFQTVWKWQQWGVRVGNVLFVFGVSILIPLLLSARSKSSRMLRFLAVLATIVLSVSLGQALVEYGENPRYSIPTQPLVICFVMSGAWTLWRAWRAGSLVRSSQPGVR
jgi:hypothetical protein